MKIIAIVGGAGVGKDTLASYLGLQPKWNVIRSHTTRPMRFGEVQGREHIFVDKMSEKDSLDLFAYTLYGGYEYWTTWSQFYLAEVNIYVVDEKGLADIVEKTEDTDVELISIHLTASKEQRLSRGVTEERIARDDTRILTEEFQYDYEIVNNGSVSAMFYQANEIIKEIKNEP